MSTCVAAASAAVKPPATTRTNRVMRWTFTRGDESIVCELGLNADDFAYELRVTPPENATGIGAELFHDAMSAFERHDTIERTLIDAGWSLERFESGRAAR